MQCNSGVLVVTYVQLIPPTAGTLSLSISSNGSFQIKSNNKYGGHKSQFIIILLDIPIFKYLIKSNQTYIKYQYTIN
jgi:hypothetical protein